MNLFVGNLSPETSEDQLRKLFSEFGGIKSTKIPLDSETGLPRGFGFVEMEDKFEGYDAIDNLDCTFFMGTIITVKESKPKNQGGGGFNRNRSFNREGGGGGFNRNRNFNRTDGGGSTGGGFNRNRNYNSGGGGSSYGNNRNRSNYNSNNNTNNNNDIDYNKL